MDWLTCPGAGATGTPNNSSIISYNFFFSKNDTQDSKFSAWIPGLYSQCPVLKNLRLDPELSLWYVVALPPFMDSDVVVSGSIDFSALKEGCPSHCIQFDYSCID